MMEWIEIGKELPQLNTMVKILSQCEEISYWNTYFETEFIRSQVIKKWKITHWKILTNYAGKRYHGADNQQ